MLLKRRERSVSYQGEDGEERQVYEADGSILFEPHVNNSRQVIELAPRVADLSAYIAALLELEREMNE